MTPVSIKKTNIATYGITQYEQMGTIAIDFANYLDKLNSIKDINLQGLFAKGWYQVGFRFYDSLVKNSEKLNLDIILKRKIDEETSEFSFVNRSIVKSEFLNLIVHVRVQISNHILFNNDNIDWPELQPLE